RACTLTSTSSSSATGPVSGGYATHTTPSTSSRTSPSCRSRIAVTRPRLSDSGIDQRQRHVDHALEVVDRDPLVRRVDVDHAVREVDALEAALVEDVRVGRAAREAVTRLVAAPLERVRRQ